MTSLHMRASMFVALAALALTGCDLFVSTEERIARAEDRIAQGDQRAALIDLRNALEKEPSNHRARLLLAEVSLALGDAEGAMREYARALADGASPEEAAEIGAKVHVALGRHEELLKKLQAREVSLDEPQRSAYEGYALLGLQRASDAADAFERALAIDPDYRFASLGLARALESQGRSDDSLRVLAAILEEDPTDAATLLARGLLLAKQGRYDAASRDLAAAREHAGGELTAPQYMVLLAALVESQVARRELSAAKQTHADLATRAPKASLTHLLAARIAIAGQDYRTAVSEAQRAVAAAPELVEARLLLGVALLARGSLNQAETHLMEVVRRAPENLQARKLLAQVNLQLQRPEAAIEALAPSQAEGHDDAQVNALLGLANLQRDDDANAISFLERSVAARPTDRRLRLQLAGAYLHAGQNQRAIDLLREHREGVDVQRDALLIQALAAEGKDASAAKSEIERLVAAYPRDVDVLSMAGVLYARLGDATRARSLLARALDLEPQNVSAALSLARVQAHAGQLSEAAATLQRATATDSPNGLLTMALAELFERMGRVDDAKKLLEKVSSADASATAPRLFLARLYLRNRDVAAAEALVNEVKGIAEGDPAVTNAIGEVFLDAGRFEQALAEFRSAAQGTESEPKYWLNAARAQLALGNATAARESAEKAVAARPDDLAANALLVMLDAREGKQDQAGRRVAQLRKLRPSDANVALLEGDLAFRSESYAAAAQAYARALGLDPSTVAAVRLYRARSRGGLSHALEPLEDRVARHPEDTAVRIVLAEAYLSEGKKDRAIEQYEILAQMPSPSPMALNNLAWLYHEQRDSRASAFAKRAYDAMPGHWAIADTYGWILVMDGHVDQGLPILEKAVEDSQGHPDARYHYAAALARAGQSAAALRELKELTRSQQAFSSKADALELLRELEG